MRIRLPLIWLLVGGLLLGGAAFRLGDLDRLPLTPAEATSALGAAESADLGSPFWSGQENGSLAQSPLYTDLTGRLMAGLGVNATVARLLPAVAGVILLSTPLLLVGKLGWWTALLAIGLLAISPTAQAVARTAGGTASAVTGLVVALFLLVGRQEEDGSPRILIGLSLGWAAASGTSFWMGIFGLLLGFLLMGLRRQERQLGPLSTPPDWRASAEILVTALVTLLVLATWFGTRLQGLGEAVAAVGGWISGWLRPGEFLFLTAVALVPLYEFLPLVGGAASLLTRPDREDPLIQALLFWALGALLAYLLYPGRSPGDLVWFVVPAAMLAARFLLRLMGSMATLEAPYTALSLSGLVLVLLLFAYFQLEAAEAGLGLATLDSGGRVGFAAAGVLFLVAVLGLFGVGWSWRETGMAFALAMAAALSLASTSFAWRLTLDRTAASGRELWRPAASTQSLDLLAETLEAVAVAEVGREGGLRIEVRGQAPANLAWALREHRPAAPVAQAGPPPVILAPEDREPGLPADYLGQAFGVTEYWNWLGALPPDLLAWWLDRQAPTARERWVMFVRTDVAILGDEIRTVEAE